MQTFEPRGADSHGGTPPAESPIPLPPAHSRPERRLLSAPLASRRPLGAAVVEEPADSGDTAPIPLLSPSHRQPPVQPGAASTGHLLCLRGPRLGEVYRLDADDTIVGRARDASIRLIDASVSRRHARFVREDLRYLLEDLGSRNGSYLNGAPLSGPAHLSDGDVVHFGTETLLQFSSSAQESELFRTRLTVIGPRDPVTETMTSTLLLERLRAEFSFANRHQVPLALLLIDVNLMGTANRLFGRDAGDRVLWELATRFRRSIRVEDILCRWRDDEFVILCRGTDRAGANVLAERLRHQVAAMPIYYEDFAMPLTVTTCIVVAPGQAYPTPDSLLHAAVAGVIVSKAEGNNRILIR